MTGGCEVFFVLNVICHNGDVAHVVVTTTLPVLDCLWLEKYNKLLLRTISTRRNVLSLRFLQRRHVPPFSSHDKPAGSARRDLSLNRQASSKIKPTTSPFHFV